MYLFKNYRSVFLLWPVLCFILETSAAAVTDTDCTPAHQTNGDKKCKDVDTNAECPANGNTCACKTGYKVDPEHDTKCLKIVITQVDCSPGASGDTKCKGVDTNSECPTSATKCACKTGYTGTDICSKESSANSAKATTTLIAMSILIMIVGPIM